MSIASDTARSENETEFDACGILLTFLSLFISRNQRTEAAEGAY